MGRGDELGDELEMWSVAVCRTRHTHDKHRGVTRTRTHQQPIEKRFC